MLFYTYDAHTSFFGILFYEFDHCDIEQSGEFLFKEANI